MKKPGHQATKKRRTLLTPLLSSFRASNWPWIDWLNTYSITLALQYMDSQWNISKLLNSKKIAVWLLTVLEAHTLYRAPKIRRKTTCLTAIPISQTLRRTKENKKYILFLLIQSQFTSKNQNALQITLIQPTFNFFVPFSFAPITFSQPPNAE